MLKLYICLALLHVTTGSPLGKIFGGTKGLIKDYPFLVNLRRSGKFRCAGFLVSPNCVLTAAHCMEEQTQYIGDLTVHAQQQRLSDPVPGEHVRAAWYAAVSPDYSPRCSYDSDIAMIKLRYPFDIGGNASLVKLDFNDLPTRSNLTIVGWGMTNDKYPYDPNQTLQTARVQSLTQQDCMYTIGKFHPMTDNMFCAIGDKGKDACSGDSGGPILYNNRAVGLVSWGYGCGEGYPGVYTRLSSPQMSSFVKYFMKRHC